jgi:hypothetical protein
LIFLVKKFQLLFKMNSDQPLKETSEPYFGQAYHAEDDLEEVRFTEEELPPDQAIEYDEDEEEHLKKVRRTNDGEIITTQTLSSTANMTNHASSSEAGPSQ